MRENCTPGSVRGAPRKGRSYRDDIKTMKKATAILFLGVVLSSQARADSAVVGTWVKHHTQQEDHAYPGDTNWNLEVRFQANDQFVWHSTRAEGTNVVDESVKGTYSIKQSLITFRFQKPSPAARKRLPEWFAFWPSNLKGQQTFRFRDEFLILGYDGNKLWLYLKKKDVEQ